MHQDFFFVHRNWELVTPTTPNGLLKLIKNIGTND